MGATVENKGQTVINTGSAHTAQSEDPCFNGKHQNCAYSKDLVFGTTAVRTQIHKGWVAMEFTVWNPSESSGKVGVNTFMTKSLAMVTQGSRDLKVEGRWAARRDDKTKQNLFNSSGTVVNGFVKPELGSMKERMANKCFLKRWEGTAKSGAKLGWAGENKTGTPYWLEIYDTDPITFKAFREDITDPGKATQPKCMADPQHTIWTANGKKFPWFWQEVKKGDKGTDTYVLNPSDYLALWANNDFMAAAEEGDMDAALAYVAENLFSKWATNDGDATGPANAAGSPEHGGMLEGAGGPDGMGAQDYGADANVAGGHIQKGGTSDWDAAGDRDGKGKWNDKQDDDMENWDKPVKKRDFIPSNWPTVLFYFWWWIQQPSVEVTASSCGGALKATVKIHPQQKIKFDINLSPVIRSRDQRRKKKAKQDKKDLGRQAYKQGKEVQSAEQAVANAKQSYGKAAGAKDVAAGAKEKYHPGAPGGSEEMWNEAGNKFLQEWNNMVKFKAKWDSAARQLESAKAALNNTQKGIRLAQKIADAAKQPLKVRFCENLRLEVKLSYERTSDRRSGLRDRYYTTAMMGQRWEFKLQVQPLIMLTYRVYFSLLNFLNIYVPYSAQLLRKFRIVRADLYFMISVSLTVSGITVTKTEHDDITIAGPSIETDIVPRFGIIAGVGGVDIIDGYISAPINVNFQFLKPNKKGSLLLLQPKVRITNYYKIVVFPDRWWEIEATSGQIKGLRFFFNYNGRFKANIASVPA